MTDRIDEIRERWSRATPGAWKADHERSERFGSVDVGDWGWAPDEGPAHDTFKRRRETHRDAEAIAAAPSDVAYLLRVAEAVRDVLGEYEYSDRSKRAMNTHWIRETLRAALEDR
jgi:hypothetical protein